MEESTGMSMKVKICLTEDMLIAYERAVGDVEVQSVSWKNGQ